MAVFSIIQKSQLEGAKRLDAEYYQPEYLDIKNKMLDIPYLVLGEHAFVTDGEHGSVDFLESGIAYLTAENVQEGFLDLEGVRFVSQEIDRRNRRASLQVGDITLSIKGTVGMAAMTYKENLPANMNRDVARIHIKGEEPNPFFLVAFLNSRFGRGQTLRESSGNVQQMITLARIRQLLVPRISIKQQTEITDLCIRSHDSLIESWSLYSQAEQMLLEELGLQHFEEDGELWNVVYLSETKDASRMDAEYFQPKYGKLFKQLKKHNARPLGELVTMKKGVEPGSEAYTDEGKLFIRVSSVSKFGLSDKDQKYISDRLYRELKDTYAPKAGELLLTKDATPGIACVLKEKVEGIVSGGVLRLKLKENMDAEYLALCVNSPLGRLQAERDAGGSIIAHWKPEQIKQVLILILPENIQQRIAELVRESHAARAKAGELLAAAKCTVEEWVESWRKKGS